MRIKRFLTIAAASLMLFPAFAQRKGFAVVIDPLSSREASAELADYIAALEQVQGFTVYTVIDRWGVPDSIRAELKNLYDRKKDPIAGAVFIGDIPIPMIRDAQFLTSAFKMDQSRDWVESSVPSDRFYDDFGLRFDFLRRDEGTPLFYYSLAAEGNQYLHPSIFSGRIRPTDAGGTSRYEKLRRYLRKATAAKRNPEPFKGVFIYTGSGSLNESKTAHIDEMKAVGEHFPELISRGGYVSYMDYTDRRLIKEKLMSEMMRPDLSLGIMHHHGDFDTQYLSSYPKPSGIQAAFDYLMHCYRNRFATAVRYGQDVDSVRTVLEKSYGLPEGWLAEAASEEGLKLEDLIADSLNLILRDFADYGYKPNCRVAIYDACYNGAFNNEDCIANEYIFQEGKTVAGIGGTVNVLQDKWPDKLSGLLAEGVMVGIVNQYNIDLEMHVVGDPTFTFASPAGSPDYNSLIINASPKKWKRFITRDAAPDVQVMALELLKESPLLGNSELLGILRDSPYGLVRLQAFEVLRFRNAAVMEDAILEASDDAFELLQRFAVNEMPRSGDPRLIPALARLIASNNTSARVEFNAMQAVQFFPADEIVKAVENALDSISPYVVRPAEYKAEKMAQVRSYAGRWDDDYNSIVDGTASERFRRSRLGFMKIYLPPYIAPKMAKYALSSYWSDSEMLLLLSSFGWHGMGYQSDSLREMAISVMDDPTRSAEVKREALKTLKRLK